jgi:hypothetical protein
MILDIKDNLLMIIFKEKEKRFILMEIFIRDTGYNLRKMVMVL